MMMDNRASLAAFYFWEVSNRKHKEIYIYPGDKELAWQNFYGKRPKGSNPSPSTCMVKFKFGWPNQLPLPVGFVFYSGDTLEITSIPLNVRNPALH